MGGSDILDGCSDGGVGRFPGFTVGNGKYSNLDIVSIVVISRMYRNLLKKQ